jgi:uncharacterized membrane protein YphA (DoxX/SURF4 family)
MLLKRLFFDFPDGWPGAALLLLRAVFGLTLLTVGECYVAGPTSRPMGWFTGLLSFVAGGLILVGFLTPVAGFVVAAGAAGVELSLLPACMPTVFDSKISLIFGLTMLVTIIGVGPGAISVDARVFGRREIVIPPRRPQ